MAEKDASPQPKLELRDVTISFDSVGGSRVLAVDGLSFRVYEHEFVALIGPSGCGKSTSLNALSGLIPVDSGQALINGRPVHGVHPAVGYISQADTLLPWRTVLDNVALGLELRGVPRRERQERAHVLLDSMNLANFEQNYPHELSGGMRKRVTIARVLAIDPEILFMDEPFGPLDAFTKEKLQNDILTIWRKSRKTVIYVTHDLTEAITLADRVLLISARPGRVRAEYPIRLPRPRTVMEVKFNPEFIRLEQAIWTELHNELDRAEEVAHEV